MKAILSLMERRGGGKREDPARRADLAQVREINTVMLVATEDAYLLPLGVGNKADRPQAHDQLSAPSAAAIACTPLVVLRTQAWSSVSCR